MPGAVAPRVGVHRLKPGGSLRALGFLGGGLGVLPSVAGVLCLITTHCLLKRGKTLLTLFLNSAWE